MAVDLSTLNPEQRDAVTHTKGPLLILAGAGSGKTRVIVHRVAYLLEKGVDPTNILAVSFTNRAVREMEERVAEMVGNAKLARKLTLSTFHSLGVKILRRDISRLGYPKKFAIYDMGDQLALVKRAMQDLRVSDKEVEPKKLLEEISNAKNRLEGPKQQTDTLIREVYAGYQTAMMHCGAVDFDDLIYLPVVLLRDEPEVKEYWAGRYRYIMVDEYQDTNPSQFELVRLLADIHGNLCVVGDDDQSIYGWRGSDIENIRQFPKQFEGTKTIMLEQNYRCSGNILEAANLVIAESADRYPKRLWTQSSEGQKISLTAVQNEDEEAQSIVNKLHQLKFDKDLKWSDFSIMYRTNAQSRMFEEKLRQERIPYRLVGGQKFFERREVRDAVAYLRMLHRPEDELAVRRIINYPNRGIGPTTIERLNHFMNIRACTFYEACLMADENQELSKAQMNTVESFVELIEEYRTKMKESGSFAQTFREFLQEIRLTHHLYKEYDNLTEAKRRVENIDALVNGMFQYVERVKDEASLDDYLDLICLDQSDNKDEEEFQNSVTLITLHGSKGLEFPVCFIAGVEEGLMPYFRTSGWTMDLEEERRLCYVGITRAKRWLFLSYAMERRRFGQLEERSPSRFLDQIPGRLLRIVGAASSATDSTAEEKEQKISSFFSNMQSLLGDD